MCLFSWSDEHVVKILQHVHDAAGDHSRLLIADMMMEHVCHDLGDAAAHAVEGVYESRYPKPLPANGGRAAEPEALLDMIVRLPNASHSLINKAADTHF